MNKLRLELDALEVESFATHAAAGAGTVAGAADPIGIQRTYPNCSEIDGCPSAWHCTPNGTCIDPSCAQMETCANTCAATCVKTCAATCPYSCYQPACSGPYCVPDAGA